MYQESSRSVDVLYMCSLFLLVNFTWCLGLCLIFDPSHVSITDNRDDVSLIPT
jgi:hypothetical protein